MHINRKLVYCTNFSVAYAEKCHDHMCAILIEEMDVSFIIQKSV